jgi:hypothetical protein
MPHDFTPAAFACYHRPDAAVVDLILALLADRGLETWRDEADLRPGDDWALAIKRNIRRADAVLAFLAANGPTGRPADHAHRPRRRPAGRGCAGGGGGEGELRAELHEGDCLDWLPLVPDASVDAIITDPPYPMIDRPYGKLTEAEWWDLMVEGVIPHVRRILKPTGSAVFILQPNSRKVGSMRGWLWEFMAWACREWNMVQDAWWWNTSAMPSGGCTQMGTLKPSVKACVWLGPADCYRDQDSDSVSLPPSRRSQG